MTIKTLKNKIMATLNKVTLIGYVGKEPDVRYLETPEHPKVAQFSLATTERMKSKDGEVKELTEWHNIVAWRGLADVTEKYIRKGMPLYVEGRLRTRSWESNGKTAYRTEIVADNIQMLGNKSDGEKQAAPAAGQWVSPKPAYQPAAPQVPAYGMTMPAAPVYDDPKDDLPF